MSKIKRKLIVPSLLALSACAHEVELSRHNWQLYNQQPQIETSIAQLTHLVFFDSDSDQLSASEQRSLLAFASAAGRTATFRLRLEGHADIRASNAYNQELSERRAQSVASMLAELGFDRTVIEEVGFGERQPATTGRSASDLARNRRVEVIAETVSTRLIGCSGQDPNRLRPTSNEANNTLGCSNVQNLMVSVEDKSDFVGNAVLRNRNVNTINGQVIFSANDRFRNRETSELPDAGGAQ